MHFADRDALSMDDNNHMFTGRVRCFSAHGMKFLDASNAEDTDLRAEGT